MNKYKSIKIQLECYLQLEEIRLMLLKKRSFYHYSKLEVLSFAVNKLHKSLFLEGNKDEK